jgi:iron complex transport system substrate-binding protein
VVACEPNALTDIWADGGRIAAALGIPEAGERLLASLRSRLQAVAAKCRALDRPAPRVACVEWQEPLMAAGNWIPELVELVGGISLFGEAGQHSPWMTWEALVAADPDVIIAMPCGFDLPRTRSEMHWLTKRLDWSDLRAVREDRVYVTDGNSYFNRPGPRLVESTEMLAEMLYPGRCDYGHRGMAWQPL